MMRSLLLFLALSLLIACQQDDSVFSDTVKSPDLSTTEIDLSSHLGHLDQSILNSDWWKGLHPVTQQLVGMELLRKGKPLTFSELQDRKQQVLNSIGRKKSCPSYPAGNPTGDVVLNSQADVDAFGALKCKEVIGHLEIIDTLGPDPICDLTPLKGIKKVGSNLTVNADCLTNLSGLEKIKSVGELGPFGFVGILGANLTDIEDLQKLSTVTGSINIIDCDQLVSVTSAFSNITTIDSNKTTAPLTSIYVLNINDNALLTDLSAFSSLTSIAGGLRILASGALLDLDDFSGLNNIGDDIFILENAALQNVNELSNITSLQDDLFVFDNPSLTECCGLYNLLCNDPPTCSISGVADVVAIFNNGAGCTDLDIIANGPCP